MSSKGFRVAYLVLFLFLGCAIPKTRKYIGPIHDIFAGDFLHHHLLFVMNGIRFKFQISMSDFALQLRQVNRRFDQEI